MGQGGVRAVGATACGSVRGGDGDAGGGAGREHGAEDHHVSAGVGSEAGEEGWGWERGGKEEEEGDESALVEEGGEGV